MSRLAMADIVKTLLTILVISHHLAITYGAEGSWFYEEVNQTVMPDTLLLTLFTGLNQSYFMGFFFFISGLFTLASIERKGVYRFIKERFLRLGIPILLFILIVYPILVATLQNGRFIDHLKVQLLSIDLSHTGPTWFLFVLLVLDTLAVIFRQNLVAIADRLKAAAVKKLSILLLIIIIGLLSYLIRIQFPDGKTILNIQISYLPQYVILFYLGVITGHAQLLPQLLRQSGIFWMVSSIAVFLFMVMMLALAGDVEPFRGAGTSWSFGYSMVQAFHALGIPLIIMLWVTKYSKGFTHLLERLFPLNYLAYFIHPISAVGICLMLAPLNLGLLVKFILSIVLVIPLTYLVAFFLRRIHFVNKIF